MRIASSFAPAAVFVAMLAVSPACREPAPLAPRPNVVILYADDLGYDDLGCYWTPNPARGYERIETPRIDRMAAEGMRFTDFYAAAPVCTPARAALLTGCYPVRVGLSNPDPERGEVLFPRSPVGLSHDEWTIAEAARTQGYATACIGKWHLGHGDLLPTHHGFDTYYGVLSRSARDEVCAVLRDETPVEAVRHSDLTRRYTEEAIRFMEEHRDRPFLIYLAHSMPHTPLAAPPEFAGTSARGPYGDVVRHLDWSTGEILDAIARLELDEKTLVLFSSDHGPAVNRRHEGGKAYPLKGGKGKTDEGGMRVPFIARWPGHVPPGVICREPAGTIDLLPAFCALAGAALPSHPIDGADIAPLLLGAPGASVPRAAHFYYDMNNLDAVRAGQWKLVFARSSFGKVLSDRLEPVALYDLETDVSEQKNLLADRTDVVARLYRMAERMREELGDDKSGAPGPGRRPPGIRSTD